MKNNNDAFNIKIPKIDNPNQMLSDAIVNSPAVQSMIMESERREREKKESNRRFWIGLIAGFILGVVASYVSSYLWWLLGPK